MRRLSAVLAGITLALALSAPSWAAGPESRHHRFSGRSESPGEGQSRGDKTQHDDPSILF